MKKTFLVCIALTFIAETVALIVFAVRTPDISQDVVAVNEVVQSVMRDFDALAKHENPTSLDYVVIDTGGEVLYKTNTGLSETINAAIAHRDTVLDVTVGGDTVGKIIINNDGAAILQSQKRTAIIIVIAAAILQCALCIGHSIYIYVTVVKPFGKLKGFARRVAGGNLDIPLEMDRGNIFGAFTESFDIMRSELKAARIAEARADASKKELVAKLSHDIKTPIASIKVVSEVGLAVAAADKDRANYAQIIAKADQINALVTNLFTATLEKLQQLEVSPTAVDGAKVATLLSSSDYLRRANIPVIPNCTVHADALRLQQVFDNIFVNSYKYAHSEIDVKAELSDRLYITIEDRSGGVKPEELPVLKEKFKRGSNAENIEGAGLGLFISDYFMNEMGGELLVENGAHGLKVTVALTVSHTDSGKI